MRPSSKMCPASLFPWHSGKGHFELWHLADLVGRIYVVSMTVHPSCQQTASHPAASQPSFLPRCISDKQKDTSGPIVYRGYLHTCLLVYKLALVHHDQTITSQRTDSPTTPVTSLYALCLHGVLPMPVPCSSSLKLQHACRRCSTALI